MDMKMKRRFGLVVAVMLFLLPGLGLAETRIAFVNMPRLMNESPYTAAAMAALQEEFAPRQRELAAKRDAFAKKQADVQRDLEVMGPEERRNAERDLRKEERDLQRSFDELNEDANLRQNEELGKLQRQLVREVTTYAQEQGFDLVLGQGVLFVSPGLDITDMILQRLKASASGAASGNAN